jgi:hypothetical protein
MAYGALTGDLAKPAHYIVAGDAGRFVDDEKPVHFVYCS